MALAANALSTVQRTLDWTGIDPALSSVVEAAINAFSALAERYCGRQFAAADVDAEPVIPSGTREILLARTPVISVASVTQDGAPILDFRIADASAGILYRADGWPTSNSWAGASGDAIAGTSAPTVAVDYRGGYTLPKDGPTFTLPADLELACWEAVGTWVRGRRRDKAIASQTIGEASASFLSGGLPEPIKALLDHHARGSV